MRVLSSLWTPLRMRTWIYRYGMRVLDALGHAPLMDPATRVGPRTAVIGLDPLRILVFGGGLAVGYGVTTRADAFDGPLVNRLAEETGRGITLENRAVQHIDTVAAIESLGLSGAHSFHLAIWSPSFAEGLRHINLHGWRDDIGMMITDLRRDTTIPLVLMHMPEPHGWHPAAVVARPWVQRMNRMIDRVAEEHRGVSTVATAPYVPGEIGQAITSPAYFAEVAELLLPAVLAALRVPARQPL